MTAPIRLWLPMVRRLSNHFRALAAAAILALCPRNQASIQTAPHFTGEESRRPPAQGATVWA
jgi:hypothetical protein